MFVARVDPGRVLVRAAVDSPVALEELDLALVLAGGL
jgi:hypothetical protein